MKNSICQDQSRSAWTLLALLIVALGVETIQASENACLAGGYPTVDCPAYRPGTTVEEARVGLDWYTCVYDALTRLGYSERNSGTFQNSLDKALSGCPDHELDYLSAYPSERHEVYKVFQVAWESPPPRPTRPGVTVMLIPEIEPGGAAIIGGLGCKPDGTPAKVVLPDPSVGLVMPRGRAAGEWMVCVSRSVLAAQRNGSTDSFDTAIDIAERSCFELRAEALEAVGQLPAGQREGWLDRANAMLRTTWDSRPFDAARNRIRADWSNWADSQPVDSRTTQAFYAHWKDQWSCHKGQWLPNALSQEFVEEAISGG